MTLIELMDLRTALAAKMDAALARRREKRLREFPKRSAASLKGWATRKEMGL